MKKLINALLFVSIMILAFHHLQQFLSALNIDLLVETESYKHTVKASEFVLFLSLSFCMFLGRRTISRTLSWIALPFIIFEIVGYFFLIGGAFGELFINPIFTYVYSVKNVIIFIYFLYMVKADVSLRHLSGSFYIISPIVVMLLAASFTINNVFFVSFKLISAILFIIYVVAQRRYDQLHSRKINF